MEGRIQIMSDTHFKNIIMENTYEKQAKSASSIEPEM